MSYCLFSIKYMVTCFLETVLPGEVVRSKGNHDRASVEVRSLSIRLKFCGFDFQCLHDIFVEPNTTLHEN